MSLAYRRSWPNWLLALGLTAMAARSSTVVLVAGGGPAGDGSPAVNARLHTPFAVAFEPGGNLLIVEMEGGERVRRVAGSGLIATVAGTGRQGSGGDNGPALQAEFNGMHHAVAASDGTVYLADTWNNRVRKLDPKTGMVMNVAGTGEKGYAGDGGLATQAKLGGIYCLALDREEKRLFMADLPNRRIRYLDLKSGNIQTFAGNGDKGVPADGADAAKAPLVDPRAVAVDGKNQVYILERSGHALRVVNTQGQIRTVAGNGQSGASGDGGEALRATFNGPKHLCIDLEDNVLIADAENHLIRKYDPRRGTIQRVMGTGRPGNVGVGGRPEEAELNRPHGVGVSSTGLVYVVDSYNNRVLKIQP